MTSQPPPHIPPEGTAEQIFEPRDAVGEAVRATGVTSVAGLFVSTVQNTLTRQNVGAWGVFARTGGTIAVFAAMGGSYEFFKHASANLREKDDAINSSIGGFVAGTMLGLRFRSAPAVIGYGSALAVILGAFTYTGSRLQGYRRDPDVDEVSRKEYLRKNRRRPVEGTVHELGEGRGVYAPGYEGRRVERIKEAYGIDVTNPRPAVGVPQSS